MKYFSDFARPMIVAEISGNHCNDLDVAIASIRTAAEAGADAVKVQTYTADSMTIRVDSPPFMANPNSIWAGRHLYDLYHEASLPWSWHEPLAVEARKCGLIFFSSPFDEAAVDFLDALDVPFFKIASFECVDTPLIEYAAKKGKPLIISTGMATMEEIGDAVSAAIRGGLSLEDLMLLKCTSNYPAAIEDSNLSAIKTLKDTFKCHVGLSDHTVGVQCAQVALALGAELVEKHFVLSAVANRAVDGGFSATESELKRLVGERNRIQEILGSGEICPSVSESESRSRRRSVYVVQNIRAGEILTLENIRRIRPGLGLEPKYFEAVLGRKAKTDLPIGHPLEFNDLE